MKSFSKNNIVDYMDSNCKHFEQQNKILESAKASGSNNYESVDYFNSMNPKFKFDPNGKYF